MEWWLFLIFHRGGLRIKVINNNGEHCRARLSGRCRRFELERRSLLSRNECHHRRLHDCRRLRRTRFRSTHRLYCVALRDQRLPALVRAASSSAWSRVARARETVEDRIARRRFVRRRLWARDMGDDARTHSARIGLARNECRARGNPWRHIFSRAVRAAQSAGGYRRRARHHRLAARGLNQYASAP